MIHVLYQSSLLMLAPRPLPIVHLRRTHPILQHFEYSPHLRVLPRLDSAVLESARPAGLCYSLSLWRNITLRNAPLNRKELFLPACLGVVLPPVPVWLMRPARRY